MIVVDDFMLEERNRQALESLDEREPDERLDDDEAPIEEEE